MTSTLRGDAYNTERSASVRRTRDRLESRPNGSCARSETSSCYSTKIHCDHDSAPARKGHKQSPTATEDLKHMAFHSQHAEAVHRTILSGEDDTPTGYSNANYHYGSASKRRANHDLSRHGGMCKKLTSGRTDQPARMRLSAICKTGALQRSLTKQSKQLVKHNDSNDNPNAVLSASKRVHTFHNLSLKDAVDLSREDHFRAEKRSPELILQPDSSPISKEQLAAEVKGIYAGLVIVEAKCISIDAAQAADHESRLDPEQWQALIALHRTLLYEHHDFLMATQHPSADESLRSLATKYSMAARMWKHGIHAFLEVLRHRRPESQDYMLAFIYLAYQMIALLYETVESFKDTWIECLGDLARYRMAIEEEKEAHATWGGVAARWYALAADRHPAIGRLNHHLGILERPSIRKMYLYSKSLTCVLPFPNAKDSMATLCSPFWHDDQLVQSSNQPTEASIMHYLALLVAQRSGSAVRNAFSGALTLLRQEPSSFFLRIGVPLAVTNVAAQFQFGLPSNDLRALFADAIKQSIQASRPSSILRELNAAGTDQTTIDVKEGIEFCFACLDIALDVAQDLDAVHDVSPFVHVMLVWMHSIISLRRWTLSDNHVYTEGVLIGKRLSFGPLSLFLNTLIAHYPLQARMFSCIEREGFLGQDSSDYCPLPEDFMIRGLVWSQFYFAPDWFDGKLDEDGRNIETEETKRMRVERMQWLGLFLARNTHYLHFDVERQRFSTIVGDTVTQVSFQGTLTPPPTTPPSVLASTESRSSSSGRSPLSDTLSAKSEVSSSKDSWAVVGKRPRCMAKQNPVRRQYDHALDITPLE